ncbi:MAG TPA: hypothetical protein VGM34_00140 [Chlamydiales bacterium]|jgi:hypothetical protein
MPPLSVQSQALSTQAAEIKPLTQVQHPPGLVHLSPTIHPSHQVTPSEALVRRGALYLYAEKTCNALSLLVGSGLVFGPLPFTAASLILLFFLLGSPFLLDWDLARHQRLIS